MKTQGKHAILLIGMAFVEYVKTINEKLSMKTIAIILALTVSISGCATVSGTSTEDLVKLDKHNQGNYYLQKELKKRGVKTALEKSKSAVSGKRIAKEFPFNNGMRKCVDFIESEGKPLRILIDRTTKVQGYLPNGKMFKCTFVASGTAGSGFVGYFYR